MSRARAEALVLVNWKGVFYERYLIDRHVTALEGANGAGKTTVMIAAYVALLPDMSRLRFTNLGETGATGGDKGIWGRLGEPGRPAYSAIDFAPAPDHRLVAGVHLERKGEPSVEPTPFVISGLDTDVRLQDVLLLSQGDHEVVPELSELRENAARLGGRIQVFGTARDYFAALFDHGVTPLRLGTDEERNKLNEMLRTSMTGGISRALTSELRSFLLKEESGLADTLRRMKSNLDACRRTRTEVRESQRLEREIGGVFEAGQTLFAAAFLATRERADELRRRLADAEEARRKARQRLAEAEARLSRVRDELGNRGARQEALANEVGAAEDWLRRLRQALEAAREVACRRDELSSAEADTRIAADERTAREEVRTRCRATRHRCRDDHRRAGAGLADLQRGLDELHRRAGAYRQVLRRKGEAERLLETDELATGAIAGRMAESKTRLEQVDRSRRDAKRRLADADEHRREHAAALAALEFMADAAIEPDAAHGTARHRLRRFRDLKALAGRLSTIAAELAEARKLASRQAEAREQADKLGLPLSEQRSARIEITERLERTERERERLLEQARAARTGVVDCRRTLDTARMRQEELGEREPIWRDLATRAKRLADELDRSLASLPELQAARGLVAQHLVRMRARESALVESRERLQQEARELLAAGGPFDPELLRLKDTLDAELLAGAYEDASLEDAAVLEARLGPLVQALAVDDPATAANQVHGRSESLSDVWLVGRDEDAARLGMDAAPQGSEATDVVVSEQRAIRVTRIPTRPRLGRKAREKRAAELRAEADALDARIEAARAERRRIERLAEDGEALLAGQAVWSGGAEADVGFADACLDIWLAVCDWLRRRLPAQVAEVDDPREALLRLRDQLTGLEERLGRQEDDLRGASEDVARGIDVQIRKARGQVGRLNRNLGGVRFGSIEGIRVKVQAVERMEQVLRALREGAVQGLLFQEDLPVEEALDEIFRRYGGGRTGGRRLLDYREYVHLQVEVRRTAGADWEIANPTRLSTGEAIGVGAALMMVVLTEWERDANLLRGKRAHGSLRFLFLDEANRLSHDNLGVLFDLCRTLDLQLLIAAPEVARADGNTTYRLVRRVDAGGREEVLVSGRRTRAEA